MVEFLLERKVETSAVKFFRFLSILNRIKTQLNQTAENCLEIETKAKKASTPIATLPNELLIKILSQLSTQDLRENVAHVSKQFQVLCKSPLVHQVVTVNTGENEADFLRGATMMTELHLYAKDGQDGQEELMAIANHSQLNVLCVYGCVTLEPVTFYSLSSSKWWGNLKEFKFEFALDFNPKLDKIPNFDFLLSKLGSNGNLTSFCFGGPGMFTRFDPTLTCNFIKGPSMSKLESLVVNELYSPDQMDEIVEARKETLKELTLNIGCLSSYEFCSKLRHLTVDESNLHILPNFLHLTSLEISFICEDVLIANQLLPPGSLPNLTSLKIESQSDYGFADDLDLQRDRPKVK